MAGVLGGYGGGGGTGSSGRRLGMAVEVGVMAESGVGGLFKGGVRRWGGGRVGGDPASFAADLNGAWPLPWCRGAAARAARRPQDDAKAPAGGEQGRRSCAA